jgi:hypothetical protein
MGHEYVDCQHDVLGHRWNLYAGLAWSKAPAWASSLMGTASKRVAFGTAELVPGALSDDAAIRI